MVFLTCLKTSSKRFSASSMISGVSAMEVYRRLPASVTMPFAIYSDDTIVGFVSMYVGEDNYQIINFLIDDAFQRKGYGSKAVKLCIEYLQREFSACRISAPVKMEHIAAQEFWIKQGFCLSDTIEDGYVFMRLFLT